MKTYTDITTKEYKLFTQMYPEYDYSDFYFDEQNDSFISKFIGKDAKAVELTVLYKNYVKNYSVHESMNKSIQNIEKMKIDPNMLISGDQLNEFLDKMANYLKGIGKDII